MCCVLLLFGNCVYVTVLLCYVLHCFSVHVCAKCIGKRRKVNALEKCVKQCLSCIIVLHVEHMCRTWQGYVLQYAADALQ
jgi:hypothetical protein